jgi:hypothetical protein
MGRGRWLVPTLVLAIAAAVTAAESPESYRSSVSAAWQPTFTEDFNTDVPVGQFPGSAYGLTWNVYPDGWSDTSGKGVYRPSKVLSVSDGHLDFLLRSEGDARMGAVVVPRLPGYGQKYGRFDVRFRASANAPGYGLAFLLWPDSNTWPDDGEIDFPEGDLTGTITATAHHADRDGARDPFDSGSTFRQWHTATIEWIPGRITFILDGRTVGTSTDGVPTASMHWVLQTGTNGEETPATDTWGSIQVDRVTAYRWQG